MGERLVRAGELTEAGRCEEATAEYVWLWEHMLEHDPSLVGVRGSFMAADMQQLVARHAPAKEQIRPMRDAAGDRFEHDPNDLEALDDWVVLNDVLGENQLTLEWYDRVKDRPDSGPALGRIDFRLLDSRSRSSPRP